LKGYTMPEQMFPYLAEQLNRVGHEAHNYLVEHLGCALEFEVAYPKENFTCLQVQFIDEDGTRVGDIVQVTMAGKAHLRSARKPVQMMSVQLPDGREYMSASGWLLAAVMVQYSEQVSEDDPVVAA